MTALETWRAEVRAGKRTETKPCDELWKAACVEAGGPVIGRAARREVAKDIPREQTREAITVSLNTVEPEAVDWLWAGRIPFGKLTVVDGDPGLGKSTLMLDLAARVTTGRAMPDGSPSRKGSVVLLTAEDGLADTVRPRLDAAGADTALVEALTAVLGERGAPQSITLPDHLDALRQTVERSGASLVIVDPLMAYLGSYVNSRLDHDMRRSLTPFAAMAEETGAAVVIVRHLNKSSGGSALYRGGGSIGIIGAARAGLLVARDPDDEERRVLAMVKCNLAPLAASLTFRLEASPNGTGRVVWEGESPHQADALVAVPNEPEARGELEEAIDFLGAFLADGERTTKELVSEARGAGISERTLKRARQALGVKARRIGGIAGYGTWVLSVPTSNNANGPDRQRAVIPEFPAKRATGVPDRGDAWEPAA
jgi:putative DNA primase/helicase